MSRIHIINNEYNFFVNLKLFNKLKSIRLNKTSQLSCEYIFISMVYLHWEINIQYILEYLLLFQ